MKTDYTSIRPFTLDERARQTLSDCVDECVLSAKSTGTGKTDKATRLSGLLDQVKTKLASLIPTPPVVVPSTFSFTAPLTAAVGATYDLAANINFFDANGDDFGPFTAWTLEDNTDHSIFKVSSTDAKTLEGVAVGSAYFLITFDVDPATYSFPKEFTVTA